MRHALRLVAGLGLLGIAVGAMYAVTVVPWSDDLARGGGTWGQASVPALSPIGSPREEHRPVSSPPANTANMPSEAQQEGWFGQVQENIRKAEYNVTWQETCVVEGEPGGLHAANRANNLRAYFREDGVQIVERETSNPSWQLRYRFTAWGRKMGTVPSERRKERDGTVPILRDVAQGTVPSKTGTVPSERVRDAAARKQRSRCERGDVSVPALHAAERHGTVPGLQHAPRDASSPALRHADRDASPSAAAETDTSPKNGDSPVAAPSDKTGTVPSERVFERDGTVPVLRDTPASDATVPIFPVPPTHEGNRVEYRHPGITEWYVNGEQGLEHGFTIVERPAGDGELVIEGVWEGLRPEQTDGGVLLKANGGAEVLRYAKLQAQDATGAVVPARIVIEKDSPWIAICDAGAAYPLTVDPIYIWLPPSSSNRHLRLDGVLESNQDWACFGESVSGAGDVNGDGYADVIVGALDYDNGQENEGGGVSVPGLGIRGGRRGSHDCCGGTGIEPGRCVFRR